MRGTSRSLWIAAAALSLAALAWSISWEEAPPAPRFRTLPTHRVSHAAPPAIGTCGVDRSLPAPSDQPIQLTCWQAKAVAAQTRDNLAQPPPPVDPKKFAATTLDWLDPHGLWSAPPDSPVGDVLRSLSPALLAGLRNGPDNRGCKAAENVGARLSAWVESLRNAFDEGHATVSTPIDPWITASETVFEDGPVRRPAKDLALDLGRRTASLQASLGPTGKDVHDAIRLRMFPRLSSEAWGQVVLAAAVRAYVLLVDAHGAWAPMDEETSLYEVELESSGRRHLWGTMTRTAAGVRVDEEPVLPLVPGDVILAIGGVSTGGLSVEQAEQLGILDPNDPHPAREVLLLRKGATSAQRVIVAPPPAAAEETPEDPYASVQLEQVPYGRGHVVVLTVVDVPDDLGLEMASALAEARLQPGLEGVVLDLRGNGGGSIEGAKEALAPFLPGAPLFPMRRRDGTVELESAPVPARTDHFSGPVAALVDPDTASAAEMIAGALSAYDRGVILGERTYGKGCAQEYLDDNAGVGVLRLSTLVYALPDGRPVQQVGLRPDIRVDFGTKAEREDTLPNAMAPWRGPDIRVESLIRPVAWPAHAGHVGPCQDAGVCKALRALGLNRSASARAR
jgi:carboxyl-terminal processing protease